MSRWQIQVVLLMLSPVALAFTLLAIDLSMSSADALAYLSYVFASTALLAVIVSGMLVTMSLKAWTYARCNFSPEDSHRLLALVNLLVNGSLFIVHTIFLVVGIASVTLQDYSATRIELTRIGLVTGQWVLLVAGISSYVIYRVIRSKVEADIESSLMDKVDEAAEVATERHVQYTDEHMKMLQETRDAAIKAAEASRKAAELAEIEQEILDKISRKLGN